MKLLFLFSFLAALAMNSLFGQMVPFIAGALNDSITFAEYDPDIILSVPVYEYTVEGLNHSIDLNNDGIEDFNFKVYNSGGNSYHSSYVILQPLNGNSIACSHFSLSTDPYGWGNDSVYTPVAKIIYAGDIIDENLDYISESQTLCTYSWAMESYVIQISDWNVPGEKYIALCLDVEGVCIYGWIMIGEVTSNSVTIMSFGFNQTNSQGFNEQQKLIQSISITPNPAEDHLLITSSLTDKGFKKIQLIDVNGKVVLQKTIDLSRDSQIFLSPSLQGFYYLRILGFEQTISKKIVIK